VATLVAEAIQVAVIQVAVIQVAATSDRRRDF
jgi:hypothetical protein